MYKDALFEWDEKKNEENVRKHGISFADAKKVFADERRIILTDIKHSHREERMYCIGMVEGIVLMVRFVYRGKKIRIFGAGAWRQAKAVYEKTNRIH